MPDRMALIAVYARVQILEGNCSIDYKHSDPTGTPE